jgi:hypothetical protein
MLDAEKFKWEPQTEFREEKESGVLLSVRQIIHYRLAGHDMRLQSTGPVCQDSQPNSINYHSLPSARTLPVTQSETRFCRDISLQTETVAWTNLPPPSAHRQTIYWTGQRRILVYKWGHAEMQHFRSPLSCVPVECYKL